MEVGDTIYCADIGVYGHLITKRQAYQIVDKNERNYRIKSNKGKHVWISHSYFVHSLAEIPQVTHINMDDEIENPLKDCIEVTIIFEDGQKRWTTFTTPDWLKECLMLDQNRRYILGDGFIIIDYISMENIKEAIEKMDRENELMEYTNPFEL